MYRFVFSLIFLITLSGCATVVQTDVMRVHNLPQLIAGKTFYMLPSDAQDGRTEYALYARDVANALIEKGMVERSEIIGSDYGVIISYSIDNGQTITSQVPVYGEMGGGTSNISGTVTTVNQSGGRNTSTISGTVENESKFGVVGSRTDTDILYTRRFELSLVDVAKSPKPREKMIYAYEGKVKSMGNSGTFLEVSKCLIRALLDDFPGRSGITEHLARDAKQCVR